MAENNEIKVKSLQKALEILNLFTEKPVLGVTEVSEYFGLYKPEILSPDQIPRQFRYLQIISMHPDTMCQNAKLIPALYSL